MQLIFFYFIKTFPHFNKIFSIFKHAVPYFQRTMDLCYWHVKNYFLKIANSPPSYLYFCLKCKMWRSTLYLLRKKWLFYYKKNITIAWIVHVVHHEFYLTYMNLLYFEKLIQIILFKQGKYLSNTNYQIKRVYKVKKFRLREICHPSSKVMCN